MTPEQLQHYGEQIGEVAFQYIMRRLSELPPEPEPQDRSMVSLSCAAKTLGYHRRSLLELVQMKQLPAYRVGRRGHWRVKLEEVEEYMKKAQNDKRRF